jgi:AbrB family looped-hinge helix DNA binding protein
MGTIVLVRIKVDRVGRVVIPKQLRVALGIDETTELEIVPDGNGLRLEPVRGEQRQVLARDGLPLLAPVGGVVLGDDDVRRLRDELQR